jgi:hypothetical protein
MSTADRGRPNARVRLTALRACRSFVAHAVTTCFTLTYRCHTPIRRNICKYNTKSPQEPNARINRARIQHIKHPSLADESRAIRALVQ